MTSKQLLNFLAITLCLQLSAQQVSIDRIDQEVILDGNIDEPFWKDISPFEYVQHSPNYGKDPSERTELRMGYDDDFLYVGAKMYDSEKPWTFALTRDGGSWSDDWIVIILDTYNDKENGLSFSTTPSGLRWDATILDGGVDNVEMNMSWNTFWDVKTQLTDFGWTAEFRIPLSSLRFQNIDGKVVMGLLTWRKISRLNEVNIYPDIAPIYGGMGFFKISKSQEIELQDIEAKNPLYVTPYLLAGFGESFEHNEDETALLENDEKQLEAGLDVKFNITSNLVLDATVNTDFAQVEADDQQVNLSRFSLFFPEKRSFFMERATSFDMNFGYNNKVFYSRRIGLNDEERVKILGGLRLVGRIGNWDLGLLNMQTEKTEEIPNENLGVLRLRRQIFNSFSNLGVILTTRLGDNGDYNVVFGADTSIKLFGDDYLKLAYAQSLENEFDYGVFDSESSRFNLKWEKRRLKGFAYKVELSRVGEDYNPGLGFESRNNYKSINTALKYGWVPGEESKIFQSVIGASSWQIFNDLSGKLESSTIGAEWTINANSGMGLSLQPRINFEYVDEELSFDDDTVIPVEEYNFNDIAIKFNTPESNPFTIKPAIELGQFYDGNRVSLSTEVSWNQSKNLELTTSYVYNNVDFSDRNQLFQNHIVRLKGILMFNTKIALTTFLQYNTANESLGSNIKLRINPSEGHDLYLVFNQSSLKEYDPIEDINPEFKYSIFMIKYNYTFRL